MKRPKFTDSQIVAQIKRFEGGLAVPQLCRELGISSATFYKWGSKFGGMDTPMMAGMKGNAVATRKGRPRACKGPRHALDVVPQSRTPEYGAGRVHTEGQLAMAASTSASVAP